MKEYFCWRCNCTMPFLDEDEWLLIAPLMANAGEAMKRYLAKHNCDLNTARFNCMPEASANFEELTGVPDVHFEIIYHHRRRDWGQE